MLGSLTVVALERLDQPIFLAETTAMAFFWSPDSGKIAYFEPVRAAPNEVSPEEGGASEQEPPLLQRVRVFDIETQDVNDVTTFLPTEEFVSRLPFFDQYHHSVTIWSPDSNSLVLSGMSGDGQPGIWVVAASGNLTPRFLTEGLIGYWSWK